jgi:NADH-quinone oxidoreductase subunit J
MEAFLFYSFSLTAILSALAVILVPRPTRALLALILTMTSLTGLYVLLGAWFVAMANLIVYAGAVLVLFLFVIMLQGIGARDIPLRARFHPLLSAGMVLTVMAFAWILLTVITFSGVTDLRPVDGSVENAGRLLFTDFLLPFELTSILLLLGVFAAVALARKEDA